MAGEVSERIGGLLFRFSGLFGALLGRVGTFLELRNKGVLGSARV